MSLKTFGRRSFLVGAGASALALPLLRSTPGALAAPGDSPKRLIVVYHGLGTMMNQWRPSGTGALTTLPPLLAPLEAHRDRMLVLSGIDNRAGDLQPNSHTAAAHSMLTAAPMETIIRPDGSITEFQPGQEVPELPPIGPSIDQLVADHLTDAPDLRRSIHLAVGHSFPGEYAAFWRDDGMGSMQYVSNEADPSSAFESLFGSITLPDAPTPTTRQRLRQRGASILDSVLSNYTSLERRVSSEDRVTLQRHAEHIRTIERGLDREIILTSGCSIPEIDLPGGFLFYDDPWAEAAAQSQIRILTKSLACDLTRVATLQFTGGHTQRFSNVPDYTIPAPGFNDWHAMVHNDDGLDLGDGLFQGYQWFSHRVAELLDELESTPDGEGSLLDNTLVLWISEFSDGGGHDMVDLPVVLFGDLQGTLRTGEHIDCSGHTTNELFVSLARAFGRNDSTFGWATGHGGERFDTNPIDIFV